MSTRCFRHQTLIYGRLQHTNIHINTHISSTSTSLKIRKDHQHPHFITHAQDHPTRERIIMDKDAGETGLGKLVKLPTELRLHIYSYVVPTAYQQTFSIDQDTGTLSLRRSPPIGLLYTSHAIRNEAANSLATTRTCKVTVRRGSIVSNVPLTDSVFGKSKRDGRKLEFPLCKGIEIEAIIPDPRTAQGLLDVRKNVESLGWTLEDSFNDATPPITARLSSRIETMSQFIHNDYAMLLGPLGQLTSVKSAQLKFFHAPGFVDQASVQQCHLIEAAMIETGSVGECTRRLMHQQLMIDIKLELALYHSASRNFLAAQFGLSADPVPVGVPRSTRLLRLLEWLAKLLKYDEKQALKAAALAVEFSAMPHASPRYPHLVPFLNQLTSMLQSTGGKTVLPSKLQEDLLSLQWRHISLYLNWAEGIVTTTNPYWT
ncbi:hypothetical protein LTR17_019652 [Elasticomyces elasticus]|nr:hypothetical protein LTR17_019652 [Elasticomyces elasticus]